MRLRGNYLYLMMSVNVESPIGLDRLATWNEVCCAMSVSSQVAFELFCTSRDFREMGSDFRGGACNLPEDTMWLAIAREMPDSLSN
jgi:hypothetical protein